MNDTDRYLKLLSILLGYPDDAFRNGIPEVEDAVSRLPNGERRSSLEKFLQDLKRLFPIEAQERYTMVFDLTPSTTLNMTYHRLGDGEKRAGVLAKLQEVYGCRGYRRTTGDLPDYLPLMLEFLSICPDVPSQKVIWDCLATLGLLVERLQEIAPAYASLLRPLERLRGKTVAFQEHSNGVDRGLSLSPMP